MSNVNKSVALSYAKDIMLGVISKQPGEVSNLKEIAKDTMALGDAFFEWMETPTDLDVCVSILRRNGLIEKASKFIGSSDLVAMWRESQRNDKTFLASVSSVINNANKGLII